MYYGTNAQLARCKYNSQIHLINGELVSVNTFTQPCQCVQQVMFSPVMLKTGNDGDLIRLPGTFVREVTDKGPA